MADDTGTKIAVVASALLALGIMFAALADTPKLCVPGQQKPCTCPDPSISGMQSCAHDGLSYGACGECPTTLAASARPEPDSPSDAPRAIPEAPAAPAAASGCEAKVGALKISNRKLAADVVATELAKAESALGACCAVTPLAGRSGHGWVRLVVGRDGKVTNALNTGKGSAAALPTCALDALRGLDFGSACKPAGPKCNAAGVVDVPLAFESK